jgi:hypothetical protein
MMNAAARKMKCCATQQQIVMAIATTSQIQKICVSCPVQKQCTQNALVKKTVTRYASEDEKERISQHRPSPYEKGVYKQRKETVERSFADTKQLHGNRYARYRDLKKVQDQCLLVATAQNIKKMALAV